MRTHTHTHINKYIYMDRVKPPYWFGSGFDMVHACLTPSSTVSSMWFVFCFIGPFCIVGLFFGCLSP